MFGSETWVVIEMDMNRLGTGEREILRRVHGPGVQQGMWRIRTDQELRELCKELDTVVNIITKRMEWTGHVVRMAQGRTVKKILESKPEGSRRMRWLQDVEKDLREMKVKRGRHKAVDGEEWVSVINVCKALRGPYNQRVSNILLNIHHAEKCFQ